MPDTEARLRARIDNEVTWQRINPTLLKGEPAITIATDSIANITSTGSSTPYAGLTLEIVKNNLTYKFVFTSATVCSTNFNVAQGDTFTSGNYEFTIASISHVWCAPKVKWGRGESWGSSPYEQGGDGTTENNYIFINSGEGTLVKCDASNVGPYFLTQGIYKEQSSGATIKIDGLYGIIFYGRGQVNVVSTPKLLGSTGNSTVCGMTQKAITDALNTKVNTSALTSDYTQNTTAKVPNSKALHDGLATKTTAAAVATAINSALAIGGNVNLTTNILHAIDCAFRMHPVIFWQNTYSNIMNEWSESAGVTQFKVLSNYALIDPEAKYQQDKPTDNAWVFYDSELNVVCWTPCLGDSLEYLLYAKSSLQLIGLFSASDNCIYPFGSQVTIS